MKFLKFIAILTAFIQYSCSENEDLLFKQNKTDINVWLGQLNAPIDSGNFNFSHIVDSKDSLMFNYRLLGYPLTSDLEFELEAFEGNLDDVQFEFSKYVINAGEYQGRFPIYFLKPENFNHFKENAGKIKFRIKETDNIKSGALELSTLTVILQNGLVIPAHWQTAPLYYLSLSRYFGTYSAVKHSLLIQLSGKTEFRIYSNRNATINDTEAMSIAEATNYKDLGKNYLIEYKKANNNRGLLDENGLEVTFP
ncbi:DUF4843 domain-containing protein [Sphingobacterium bovistauri]|uniref:DUF4843 domain-containing protein n=1 Tax=Sphingobacterium bovistauri TaxID=2781959 RepID=A0ABS7Z8N5_9SPHI|nr:DUF4843 domain-containing protein [Sphingobacterium bovistauri]MCA5006571.1 DUF4843 domain-containing protein [Sphingobacterium bovistauri]